VPAFGCGLDAMPEKVCDAPQKENLRSFGKKSAGSKNPGASKKKLSCETFSFPKRGIIIAPCGSRLYTRDQ
jgi:hypothetical protein